MDTEKILKSKIFLRETKTPGVFIDEKTGTLYIVEFDTETGKKYLKQLNNN